MEKAGLKCAEAVRQFRPEPGVVAVFFGKGHNGGDALVAARHLASWGWKIALRPSHDQGDWAPLTRLQHERLDAVFETPDKANVILDGLLGIGSQGALSGAILEAARELNMLRLENGALTFAIDLPTGLHGDTGVADHHAVVADVTLAIGCAKLGLIADGALNLVGRLAVLTLDEFVIPDAECEVAHAGSLRGCLKRRRFDYHKGDAGRVVVVAGSMGMAGAGALCASGALRGGAGLVTLASTQDMQPVLAALCPPEVMVKPVQRLRDALEFPRDVLVVGPGLGVSRHEEIKELLRLAEGPVIVDADGLNAIAGRLDILHTGKGERLLTPHPGEMARLATLHGTRLETARAFVAAHPVTLLYKGSRTVVAAPDEPLSFNSTGNPGMSTGGMGDVLSGVLGALVAQGLRTYEAARLGAWLCGRAAERCIFHGVQSEETLVASDILAEMGASFEDLKRNIF